MGSVGFYFLISSQDIYGILPSWARFQVIFAIDHKLGQITVGLKYFGSFGNN